MKLGPPEGPGQSILAGDWWGTIAFTVTAVAGVIAPSVFRYPALVVALALFAAGLVAFVVAYAKAVSRSRYDEVTTPGVFFLSGSAPSAVRRFFLVLLAVQVVVAVATASIRPFTSLAFGILVPTFGLGLMALWGARHGSFGPRRADRRRTPPARR